MQVLKIKLEAPSAHFRIPHSSNPHCTYPVPPYSTVIGIIANILGNREHIDEFLRYDFALGMLCNYRNVTREYGWYRNLSGDAHRGKYVSPQNRHWQEGIDHPGGQSPVIVEVLNEVALIIYLHHQEEVLNRIIENLEQPEKWISHIHLGRAEDWARPVDIGFVKLSSSRDPALTSNAGKYYQWLPNESYAWKDAISDDYAVFYNQCKGAAGLVSTKYRLVRPDTGAPSADAAGAIRNFAYIEAKPYCGSLPFLNVTQLPALYVDEKEACPVHMALIKGGD